MDKGWNVTQWTKYVNEGLNGAAKSIIQAGIRMYEFKTHSKCCKGGSEFGRLAKKKFGMSESTASRWVSIGKNSANLLVATKNLPSSMESVYLLSTLSKEEIQAGIKDGVITHEATQKEIKELKQQTKQKQKQEEKEDNDYDKEWDKLLEKVDGNEQLAIALWDEVITEVDAKAIQDGTVKNVRAMARKLYGSSEEPTMLPSQIAELLDISDTEVRKHLNIKKKIKKKTYMFEVTEDVVALEKELKDPQDAEALCTDDALALYKRLKEIVKLWETLIDEN